MEQYNYTFSLRRRYQEMSLFMTVLSYMTLERLYANIEQMTYMLLNLIRLDISKLKEIIHVKWQILHYSLLCVGYNIVF